MLDLALFASDLSDDTGHALGAWGDTAGRTSGVDLGSRAGHRCEREEQDHCGSTLARATSDAEASEEQTEDAPFTKQPLTSPSQKLGADPLIYPWEKREIVRRYFTPE